LHDGAVIIANNRIVSAAAVMPLSASGILNRSPERQMGLRHRAALGISEASDAISVVVSEETGSISIAHGGRMIRRLDSERLENVLLAFYRPMEISGAPVNVMARIRRWFQSLGGQEE
jgi:diadenylate cyclase